MHLVETGGIGSTNIKQHFQHCFAEGIAFRPSWGLKISDRGLTQFCGVSRGEAGFDNLLHTYVCSFFPYNFLKFWKCCWFLLFYTVEKLTAVYLTFICLSLERHSLLFTFVSKKHWSIFHTNYLINVSPYLRTLANLGCQ